MQRYAEQAGKSSLAQRIVGILGAILPGSTAGNLARLGIRIGAGTVLMKYSRDDEAQADAVSAVIMYKAGFNPKAMAEFFQKLEQVDSEPAAENLCEQQRDVRRREATLVLGQPSFLLRWPNNPTDRPHY